MHWSKMAAQNSFWLKAFHTIIAIKFTKPKIFYIQYFICVKLHQIKQSSLLIAHHVIYNSSERVYLLKRGKEIINIFLSQQIISSRGLGTHVWCHQDIYTLHVYIYSFQIFFYWIIKQFKIMFIRILFTKSKNVFLINLFPKLFWRD